MILWFYGSIHFCKQTHITQGLPSLTAVIYLCPLPPSYSNPLVHILINCIFQEPCIQHWHQSHPSHNVKFTGYVFCSLISSILGGLTVCIDTKQFLYLILNCSYYFCLWTEFMYNHFVTTQSYFGVYQIEIWEPSLKIIIKYNISNVLSS